MKPFQRGWLVAAVLTFGLSFGTARIVAAPLPQEHSHDDDYSRNPRYQEGMRDGKDDSAHHRDHYKKRHFKKEDDQKAYEYGYQQGHHEDRDDRDHHDDHEQHYR
jgi:hypothetical protein